MSPFLNDVFRLVRLRYPKPTLEQLIKEMQQLYPDSTVDVFYYPRVESLILQNLPAFEIEWTKLPKGLVYNDGKIFRLRRITPHNLIRDLESIFESEDLSTDIFEVERLNDKLLEEHIKTTKILKQHGIFVGFIKDFVDFARNLLGRPSGSFALEVVKISKGKNFFAYRARK